MYLEKLYKHNNTLIKFEKYLSENINRKVQIKRIRDYGPFYLCVDNQIVVPCFDDYIFLEHNDKIDSNIKNVDLIIKYNSFMANLFGSQYMVNAEKFYLNKLKEHIKLLSQNQLLDMDSVKKFNNIDFSGQKFVNDINYYCNIVTNLSIEFNVILKNAKIKNTAAEKEL